MPEKLTTYEDLLSQMNERQLAFFLDYLEAVAGGLTSNYPATRTWVQDILIGMWMFYQVADNAYPLESLDRAIARLVGTDLSPAWLEAWTSKLAILLQGQGAAMPPLLNQHKGEFYGHTQ